MYNRQVSAPLGLLLTRSAVGGREELAGDQRANPIGETIEDAGPQGEGLICLGRQSDALDQHLLVAAERQGAGPGGECPRPGLAVRRDELGVLPREAARTGAGAFLLAFFELGLPEPVKNFGKVWNNARPIRGRTDAFA